MSIGELFTAPDWGTVPDWLAAAGTVSAVVLALRLARRDSKRLETERQEAMADRQSFREQRVAEAEARKRGLAAKVSLVAKKTTLSMLPDAGVPRQVINWSVHNNGDEPISMVSIVQRLHPEAPGADQSATELSYTWPMIEPGGTREWNTDVYRDPQDFEYQREVQFTDGTGQRWQRKEFGAMRTIDPGDEDAPPFVMFPA
ncbi:hypothetical protein [Arthrobacter sp. C152]